MTPPASAVRSYLVSGMTCSHCTLSVSEEVSEVAGVDRVVVDLESGAMEVHGTAFDDDAVRRAVEEAGYEVSS